MKSLYVAGKSGGHIIPGITLAQQRSAAGDEIYFAVLDRPLDKRLIQNYPWITHVALFDLDTIYPRAVRSYGKYIVQLIRALRNSWELISAWQPDEIISMGGYISLPMCYVAWLRGVPVRLYELNAELGTASRFIAPIATDMRCCFHETMAAFSQRVPRYSAARISLCYYPVRYQLAEKVSKEEACHSLGFDARLPVLLVLGGSQGSRLLNEIICAWLASLTTHARQMIQIIHQTGVHEYEEIQKYYTQHAVRAVVFSYRDDLAVCYAAADGAVSRAGSGAIHELEWFGIKTLLVPLQTKTTAHQCANARAAVARNTLWEMADADTERASIIRWLTQWVRES